MERCTVILIVAAVLAVAEMLFGLIVWKKLPNPVAIHFDAHGTPNNSVPKWVAVFLLPLVLLVVEAIAAAILYFVNSAASLSGGLSIALLVLIPVVSVIVQVIIYVNALR